MVEAADNTPNLAHERHLKRQRRINDLQEKLRHGAAKHADLLESKDLADGPVLTGDTFTDKDITESREEIWKTAGELLRLEEDERPPIVSAD